MTLQKYTDTVISHNLVHVLTFPMTIVLLIVLVILTLRRYQEIQTLV